MQKGPLSRLRYALPTCMFGPKKQSAPPPLRLPKLPASPGIDDIHYLLAQAQRNRGRIVEMPWTSADRTVTWMLTVKCDAGGGEPAWLLYKGDVPNAPLAFSYVSGDVPLVYSLIIGEVAGTVMQPTSQSDTFVAIKVPPALSTAAQPAAGPGLDSGNYPRAEAKATLEGDLKNMQVPSLLQSVAISKMTGRLAIQSSNGPAEVYFDDGAPVHARALDITGEIALMELITWDEGQFDFYPEQKTHERTVSKRLDALLMEGVTLLDQSNYLRSAGLTQDSYLLRKHASITEQEFEQIASKGAPVDMNMQKQFYQSIDNKSTLFEILRRRPMPKTDWVPVLFNLLSSQLVVATDRPPTIVTKAAPLEAIGIDKGAIQGVIKSLSRPETGLMTYPAFLFFLEQEFFRYESTGAPFSLIIVELRWRSEPDTPPEPLPLTAVREMAKRVNAVKRPLDVFAHYETFDYAMLLPNTNSAAAAISARRLVELVLKTPLAESVDMKTLMMAGGVSSLPEDGNDLGLMLAAAREAKNQSKQTQLPVVMFRDMKRS